MKKTLLASAIAAVSFSGASLAQSMSPEDMAKRLDAMPSFYGNVQYAYTYTDSDVFGYGSEHYDNGTTLGWSHSHEIAPGVEGFMKVEAEINAADRKGGGSGLTDLDEAYIGVKGDSFGQVWVGSDDAPYERLVGDYGNWVFEVAALNPYTSSTTGEGDLIQYMSPDFGGLTVFAAMQVNGEGATENSQPYQLGVSYSMAGLTASLAMDSNDGDAGDSTYNAGGGNENSYGVALEYALDALVLDLYYDYRAAAEGVSNDNGDFNFDGFEGRSQIGVMGTYNLGANTFRLAYEMAETDADGLEVDVLSVQALHNLSESLYVYTEAARRNNENGAAEEEINQVSLGAVYAF